MGAVDLLGMEPEVAVVRILHGQLVILSVVAADFNPADGEQLKTMLQQLATAEQALTTLFTGSERAERHTFVFDFCPRAAVERQLLFRFSKFLGLVDADDLAGEPFYVSVANETRLPESSLDGKKKKKEKPDLRYCLPGRARITPSSALSRRSTSRQTCSSRSR